MTRAATIMLTMIVLLLLGFPMMIPLVAAASVGFVVFFSRHRAARS